jgi:hypothetical protein
MVPDWLQLIVGVSAPLIAIFAAYISYRQWQLGAYKLKHDLYERRWAIYAAAHDAIATSVNGSNDERHSAFQKLRVRALSAQFLFPQLICEYLDKLIEEILRLNKLEIEIKKNSTPDLRDEHQQLYVWLELQPKVLVGMLKKYLDLSI